MLIDDLKGIWLGFLTIIFCFIARAIMIALLVPFINLFKKRAGLPTIPANTAFMMFHSGLRGGMTVMMALMLDPYWMDDDQHKNTLLIATIVTVIGMCYLCGCTGPYFLKLLGVSMGVEQEDGALQHRRTFLMHTNRVVEMMITPSSSRRNLTGDGTPSSQNSISRSKSSPSQGMSKDDSGSPKNYSFQIDRAATATHGA